MGPAGSASPHGGGKTSPDVQEHEQDVRGALSHEECRPVLCHQIRTYVAPLADLTDLSNETTC